MYSLRASVISSLGVYILLLQLTSECEGCMKLATIDTTRKTLELKKVWYEESDNNVTLELNPFLIRTEDGNIGITLSETANDTNSRCYQIFLMDLKIGDSMSGSTSGVLQISNQWEESRSYNYTKKFSMDIDNVELVIVIKISSDGVISLKVNNKTKFIYKDRNTPINVKYISVASTEDDSYNEFYFNCFNPETNTIKY